jgi:uncharacterized protein (UPF0332 family)
MSLLDWRNGGWIRPHTSSPEEIRDLFRIVDRDLADAANSTISADSRHYIAYNGALKLCAILLYAEGYRPEKGHGSHQRAIDSLPLILGSGRQDDADYLNRCRSKRNTSAYDYAGGVSPENAEELIAFTKKFRSDVLSWLKAQHPALAVHVSK